MEWHGYHHGEVRLMIGEQGWSWKGWGKEERGWGVNGSSRDRAERKPWMDL